MINSKWTSLSQKGTKIGIIGGAGPYASALFYRILIKCCYMQKKEPQELVIVNFPFTKGLQCDDAKKHSATMQNELQHCVDSLARLDVDLIGIACNTLHLFLDKIDLRGIPCLHLPRLVMKKVLRDNLKAPLVLATPTTIQYKLYSHAKMACVHPEKDEQKVLDTIIDHVLEGKIEARDSKKLSCLIKQIAKREKVDSVILGCTDLPVLHSQFPIISKLPIFDSIQVLVNAVHLY